MSTTATTTTTTTASSSSSSSSKLRQQQSSFFMQQQKVLFLLPRPQQQHVVFKNFFMTTLASFLMIVVASSTTVSAQQYPNPALHANQFNTTVRFRQNVCERQQKYHNGEIKRLDDALEGLNLTVSLPSDSPFLNFDSDGKLNEDYPGILAILLDQVAINAKFSWRNTYTVVDAPIEGETWTDLILWLSQTYDVAADWWINTIDRTSKGIAYPESWYDASYVLVGKRPSLNLAEEEEKLALWSWLEPFDYTVWLTILLTIVGSAFIYMFLDWVDPYSDKRKLKTKPVETTFLAAMGFAGHMEFEPQTHPARLFTFSLALWALLMGAAYTANLASFLVYTKQTNVGEIPITSVEEAVQRQVPICVHGATPTSQQLKADYPNAFVIEKSAENAADKDVYQAVIDGECKVALTTYSVWRFYEQDETVNQNCQLEWVGRKYKNREAGFATAVDAGTLCTSLIRDVINLHLLRLKEQEFIEDAWQNEFKRKATIDCSSSSSSSTGENGRRNLKASSLSASASIGAESGADSTSSNASLSIKNMGGIFIMHGGFCVIAVIFALIHRWFGLQERREKEKEENNRRRHLKKMQASKNVSMNGISQCSIESGDSNDNDDDDDRPTARGLTYAAFLVEIDDLKEDLVESRKKQKEEVEQLKEEMERSREELSTQIATLISMVAENNKNRNSNDYGDDPTAETARVDSTSSACSGDVACEDSNKRHDDISAVLVKSSARRTSTRTTRVESKTSSEMEGSSVRPTRDERIRNIAVRQSKEL